MFPTQAFRNPTQRKILRVLAESNKRYTTDDLAETCHRSKASISRALKNVHRYPFIQRDTAEGSKTTTVRLDPASRYTSAIREFFKVEREQERANSVPVHVWNLLEDIATASERRIDSLIDILFFGSYATGDYYAGSDIDLLFLHHDTPDERTVTELVHEHGSTEQIQHVNLTVHENDNVRQEVYERGPLRATDTVISLLGEVDL